jgi:hypothetical protein
MKTRPDQAAIRALLQTWPLRQVKGIRVPPPDDHDLQWSWSYEQKYGAPKLAEREELLTTAFDNLRSRGANIEHTIAVLHQIKSMAFTTAVEGALLDRQREDADEADKIRRNLTKWLRRAIDLHRALNPDELPAGRQFRLAYEAMLTALTFDGGMSLEQRAERDWLLFPRPPAMRQRRATAGNPDALVINKAQSLLTEAGVHPDFHNELLRAIGVVE